MNRLRRTLKTALCIAFYLVVFALSATNVTAQISEGEVIKAQIERILEIYENRTESGYNIYERPELPPRERLWPMTELEKTGLLILVYDRNIPMNEIIKAALKASPVLVLVNLEYELKELIDIIKNIDVDKEFSEGRLRVAFLETDTPWIRDYGPIFVVNVDGEPLIIDPMYLPRKRVLSPFEFALESSENSGSRYNDEVVPYYLGQQFDISILRPPMILSGGNYLVDENGIGFTSTEVLENNGGDKSTTDLIFREYFGCKEVVYFEPLPGTSYTTTQHIDMFFQIADSNTYLLAKFEASDPLTGPAGYLQQEASERMKRNRKMLDSVLTNLHVQYRIIDVPMPNITPLFLGSSEESGNINIAKTKDAVIARSEKEDMSILELLEKHYTFYLYRSFLNFINLNSDSGRVILVPSYPKHASSILLEDTISAILHDAYTGAEVILIPCDSLIEDMGALHCISITIPERAMTFHKSSDYHKGVIASKTQDISQAVVLWPGGEQISVQDLRKEMQICSVMGNVNIMDSSAVYKYYEELAYTCLDNLVEQMAVSQCLKSAVISEPSEEIVLNRAKEEAGLYWSKEKLRSNYISQARLRIEKNSMVDYFSKKLKTRDLEDYFLSNQEALRNPDTAICISCFLNYLVDEEGDDCIDELSLDYYYQILIPGFYDYDEELTDARYCPLWDSLVGYLDNIDIDNYKFDSLWQDDIAGYIVSCRIENYLIGKQLDNISSDNPTIEYLLDNDPATGKIAGPWLEDYRIWLSKMRKYSMTSKPRLEDNEQNVRKHLAIALLSQLIDEIKGRTRIRESRVRDLIASFVSSG